MQIKRLRLTGFKSFVDPADLRIEPGLTGIVGPNGCGKSNLLEALRWAMGENSAKSMRGAGMEDVIFAGTARRPSRDFAEVSILGEGTEGSALEGELEVVRRIERGAGSAYRINGRDVRAKDVALLFADAATGAHSPALVSQGRISAVIAAKPADRRQMLEEASGIAGLHVRRKDAEQRLRATEANLERLDTVISDQEARIQALRRQARQAERYRSLSDEIRIAEGRMIFARWREAATAADAARKEAQAAETRVAERGAAHQTAVAAQAHATERLAEARAEGLAARDRSTDAMHRLATLRAEHAGAERRLGELRDSERRLTDDKAREDALAADAADALRQLEAEVAALAGRIATAEARLPELAQRLEAAERGARDAEVALAQALAEQAREAAESRVAQAAIDAARTRADRSRRALEAIEREAATIPDPAPLARARDAAAAARSEGQAHVEAARAALAEAERQERAATEARDQAQSERAAAHAELSQIESEATALQKATQRAGRDRLLDHITAAPGYEHAVAAALGDDLEAGLDREAERFWAGAEPQPRDPPAPEGTQPLGDHVEAPPALARRLAQIFVGEEDAGAALAVGQRLVTRAGSMRRWDGYVAKSGGAAAAERLQRINRLHDLERRREPARDAVAVADARLEQVGATIAQARQAAMAARQTIAAAEQQARDAQREEDRLASRIERVAAQRADNHERLHRIRGESAEAEDELRRATETHRALPDGQAMRERVAALSREAEAKRSGVAAAQAERATGERTIAADRERQAAARAEAANWRSRSGDALRRMADMEQRAVAIAEEQAALAMRPEQLAAAIGEVEAASDALRAEAARTREAEQQAEARLREAERAAQQAAEALAEAREGRAGAAARAESQDLRRVEMGRISGERFACPPPLLPGRAGFDEGAVGDPAEEARRHEKLTLDRERIGPVNLVAESELDQIEGERTTNAAEREELSQAVHRLRGSIGTLNREGRQRLLAAFEAVDLHFRRLFTTLFNGGQAHLALIDSDDPLEAGLEILAQPPGKKLQSLTLLSGGEQALTAVALIFALFLTNPAPICVLDEVDAPLDDANIDRFCDLLDRMAEETATRYLIVTHNAATMSRMHRLFGVTMVEQGVSRLVSVDLGGAETLLAAE